MHTVNINNDQREIDPFHERGHDLVSGSVVANVCQAFLNTAQQRQSFVCKVAILFRV